MLKNTRMRWNQNPQNYNVNQIEARTKFWKLKFGNLLSVVQATNWPKIVCVRGESVPNFINALAGLTPPPQVDYACKIWMPYHQHSKSHRRLYNNYIFVARFRESAGTLNLIRPSVCLSQNFNLGHNFFTISGRALILGMCSLWQDLSDGTISWPWRWPLIYFKVKFVAERGTTILWICLFFLWLEQSISSVVCLSVCSTFHLSVRLSRFAFAGATCVPRTLMTLVCDKQTNGQTNEYTCTVLRQFVHVYCLYSAFQLQDTPLGRGIIPSERQPAVSADTIALIEGVNYSE